MEDITERASLYDVLGVSPEAGTERIRQAYLEKAQELHPDRSDDPNSRQQFEKIREAYETLRDPRTREAYDRAGQCGVDDAMSQDNQRSHIQQYLSAIGEEAQSLGMPCGGFAHFSMMTASGSASRSTGTISFHGGGHFARSFSEGVIGGPPRRGPPPPGTMYLGCDQNMHMQYNVSFAESFSGGCRAVEVPCQVTCPACNNNRGVIPCPACSSGNHDAPDDCQVCMGSQVFPSACEACHEMGVITVSATVKITIPPGVGNEVARKCPMQISDAYRPPIGPNTVIVDFVVGRDENSLFCRKDRDFSGDVHTRLPLTFTELTLGAKKKIPGFTGLLELQIPPMSKPTDVYTLKGCGFPSLSSPGTRGSLMVHIQLEIPREYSPAQIELIRQLAQLTETQSMDSVGAVDTAVGPTATDELNMSDLRRRWHQRLANYQPLTAAPALPTRMPDTSREQTIPRAPCCQ